MAQTAREIVTEVHDEPHLEGRRVTVRRIQALVEERGLSAAAVADMHDLSVADVYAALTYYHEQPQEMEHIERKRADRREQSLAGDATTLADVREQTDGDDTPVSR